MNNGDEVQYSDAEGVTALRQAVAQDLEQRVKERTSDSRHGLDANPAYEIEALQYGDLLQDPIVGPALWKARKLGIVLPVRPAR